MPGLAAEPPNDDGAGDGGRGNAVYLVAVVLVVLFAAIVLVALTTLTGSGAPAGPEAASAEKARKLPVYWKIHTGDSYESIARKTGLSTDDLERFNPYVNPDSIQPGQRIQLRLRVPAGKPKPPGPRSYTVRTGDTIGSIAAKTDHSIPFLLEINKKVNPNALQPGDRIKLRR